MDIEPNDIHIWTIKLDITPEQEKTRQTVLSPDELERAKRFHAPQQRTRFIATRSALRKILGNYLGKSDKEISFAYTAHGKPYVENEKLPLQFNIAHSHDLAVCAVTLNYAIGIDIEKITSKDHLRTAQRYFSVKENQALAALSIDLQRIAFYRIWSRKEALIKAVGRGLSIPLTSFAVSAEAKPEVVTLEDKTWTLTSLEIQPGYESALATDQGIERISFWKFA